MSKDVTKDLEKRKLSWIIFVPPKYNHIPSKKEADRVLRKMSCIPILRYKQNLEKVLIMVGWTGSVGFYFINLCLEFEKRRRGNGITEVEKIVPKFIWDHKISQIPKEIPEDKEGSTTLPNFKLC